MKGVVNIGEPHNGAIEVEGGKWRIPNVGVGREWEHISSTMDDRTELGSRDRRTTLDARRVLVQLTCTGD